MEGGLIPNNTYIYTFFVLVHASNPTPAACFCTPCVISQMLRHTFNYKMQCDECNLSESRVASIV